MGRVYSQTPNQAKGETLTTFTWSPSVSPASPSRTEVSSPDGEKFETSGTWKENVQLFDEKGNRGVDLQQHSSTDSPRVQHIDWNYTLGLNCEEEWFLFSWQYNLQKGFPVREELLWLWQKQLKVISSNFMNLLQVSACFACHTVALMLCSGGFSWWGASKNILLSYIGYL